jgi:hypothetical protein
MSKYVMALALVLSATAGFVGSTTVSLAQSQPNYGPNSPGGGDTYGEPYSGTAGAKQKAHGW